MMIRATDAFKQTGIFTNGFLIDIHLEVRFDEEEDTIHIRRDDFEEACEGNVYHKGEFDVAAFNALQESIMEYIIMLQAFPPLHFVFEMGYGDYRVTRVAKNGNMFWIDLSYE